MFTQNLTLARFNNQTINRLAQHLLQYLRLIRSGIAGIFQYNAVAVCSQYPIHSLNQSWKNIIGYISNNNRNIAGGASVYHPFGTKCPFAVISSNKTIVFQNRQRFSHCMTADIKFRRQLILRRKLFTCPDLS